MEKQLLRQFDEKMSSNSYMGTEAYCVQYIAGELQISV